MTRDDHQGGAAVARRMACSVRRPPLRIEFPRPDERISTQAYTFRLEVGATAQQVELCIDQGEWRACREALGFWWYDWRGYDCGRHVVVARSRGSAGETALSESVCFEVLAGK